MNYNNEGSSVQNHCGLCSDKLCSPRVLSCLHVFCEVCLDKLLNTENGNIKSSIIICPICQQETPVSSKGAASLPSDYILTNILDMLAIKNTSVLCTSCTAMENAVACCSDCANFLCPNCNTAHKFMRCFENHTVIALDDLRKSDKAIPIHKPIFCSTHPTENMKFYCYTCQVPICNECLLVEHKVPEHQYKWLKDAEPDQRKELINLVNECKARIEDCDQISSQLGNALSELQVQRDQTKDLILETSQNYKAILEKCRDKALEDLEKIHSKKELEIMDYFRCLEKTIEKIECACQFTNRLLEHGDTIEFLSLCRIVTTQLTDLLKNMLKPNITPSIEFQTDYNNFEKTIEEAFGRVLVENLLTAKSTDIINVPAISAQQLNHTPDGCPNLMSTSSPVSLPTSMQLSCKDNRSFVIPSATSPNIHTPLPLPISITPDSIQNLTNTQKCSHPSPILSFTLDDLLTGDFSSARHTVNNLQVLTKLGNSLNNQERGSSPVIIDASNLGSLTNDTSLNGHFELFSPSTSPILPQGADDICGDTKDDMSIIVNNSGSNVTSSLNNFTNYSCSTNSKLTPMQIRWKFGQLGPDKGQFNSPHGFCLGTNEDIIVADTNNHRIQVFEKTGTFKFQFGIPGKEEGQLWFPRKVAVIKNSGKFVVCDRGNERSRMQIFTKNGNFIKKIAIRYIDIVAGLAVTSHGHIVAVDSVSPTIFIISDTGDFLKWFDCSDYMREPSDIAISGKEYFVCDFKGHCVVVFNEDGQFLRRIGCENITNFPNGIDISDAGDVLIGDSHGNRFHIAVFSKDGFLISEFECPSVKVSRCCGLKITSEGYIVTLAKNNQHVLVLNTLYLV